MKEVTERKFRMKMAALGYSPEEVEKKFLKASSAARMKAGLARKAGKTTYVFMPKAREVSTADVMALNMKGDDDENFMSASSAKQMLHGQFSVDIGSHAKRNAFGGIICII